MTSKRVAIATCILCLSIGIAFAQEKTAQDAPPPVAKRGDFALIFVTVFDAQGRSMSGVPVKIRRVQDKNAKWDGYSDRRGEFAQRLTVGKMDYVVWADLKDRAAAKKSEVKISIEYNERQDVSLHLN
jgi:hypothetical protein